jgi:hypothetical protein
MDEKREARPVMRRALLVLLSVTALVGCNTIIGVRGSGTTTSETRDVDGFSHIVIEGSGRVVVDITGTESLTIEAEDNLMSHVTSEVEDGRLILGIRGPISATRDIVYTITAISLDGVTISGSGDFEADDIGGGDFAAEIRGSGSVELTGLEVDRIEARISGSGDMEASGTSDDLDVSISGSGNFAGESLQARNGGVTVSGSGSAVVNVTETLDASVRGSGNIEYLGDPVVDSSIAGSGTIRSR